jgi:hypothetical protein
MKINSRSIAIQGLLLTALLTLSACFKGDQAKDQATAQATAIANSTFQPNQAPKPLDTSSAVTENLEAAKLKNLKLQSVFPEDIAQPNQLDLAYFQGMGPLEHAVRLTGIPTTPAWRIRLRLYPENTGRRDGFSYRVKVDHYNLSPALYRDVVSAYGKENADPSLNNTTPHQHIQMIFRPVMNVVADFDPTSLKRSQSNATQNPRDCRLVSGCADLFTDLADSQWGSEQERNLVRAPWEQKPNSVYAMVRGLSVQAGKLKLNGNEMVWRDGEIPEGVSQDRPWIEVLIDNYSGNAGGYQAYFVIRAADDSIMASVFRMYTDGGMVGNAIASRAYICARGNEAGKLRAICS